MAAKAASTFTKSMQLQSDESDKANWQFWTEFCKSVPDQGKVGDSIQENEILVLDIDSIDIWLHVNLVM